MDPRHKNIERMFNPRSIVFVGATETLGKWGFIIFNNLITGGYAGKLYPVNPGRKQVLGYKAYPSVRDVPGDVDLAVFTVPAATVEAAMEDCVEKGVKAGVVISAGFKEKGGEAAAMEARIVERARAAGMVLVGPNGQGVCCPGSNLYAWMPNLYYPPAGPVSSVSQSGNVQGLMVKELLEAGIGVAKCVSSGNEADLATEDYLDYFAEDPATKVILSYVEGLAPGSRFLASARNASRQKPVVLLKGGRSEFGVSAARSHTGALAVRDEMFDAACRQAGVIRAHTIYESAVLAASFVNRPLPKGRRVGIVTGGGGLGVIAADMCAQAGLVVPRLSQRTMDAIADRMPDWWVPGNPVDLVAGLDFSVVPHLLKTLVGCGEIDALLLLFIGPGRRRDQEFKPLNEQTVKMQKMWKSMEGMFMGFREMLTKLADETGTPAYVVSNFGEGSDKIKEVMFAPDHTIFFKDIESACKAIAAMAYYREFLEKN